MFYLDLIGHSIQVCSQLSDVTFQPFNLGDKAKAHMKPADHFTKVKMRIERF